MFCIHIEVIKEARLGITVFSESHQYKNSSKHFGGGVALPTCFGPDIQILNRYNEITTSL